MRWTQPAYLTMTDALLPLWFFERGQFYAGILRLIHQQSNKFSSLTNARAWTDTYHFSSLSITLYHSFIGQLPTYIYSETAYLLENKRNLPTKTSLNMKFLVILSVVLCTLMMGIYTKDDFPLPSCYRNNDGFMCCNRELESLMDFTYRRVSTSRSNWSKCNFHQIAVETQKTLEKRYKQRFEAVVGGNDYASLANFDSDLNNSCICFHLVDEQTTGTTEEPFIDGEKEGKKDKENNESMKPGDLYLFGYNAVQFIGWGIILAKTIVGLLKGLSFPELYKNVELELQIFQTMAILEIVHCIVGLVRSPVGTTLVQVFSRVTVVWLILYKVASSRASIGVPMLLVAWSITECIRYSYYALNLVNSVPLALTWMRYTFFIALYPLGASGEVITMLAALPEIDQRKHFTLEMPNALNFGFSFWWCVIGLCLIYLPGFPQLYGYMFVQRRKVLGSGKGQTESTKKVQ